MRHQFLLQLRSLLRSCSRPRDASLSASLIERVSGHSQFLSCAWARGKAVRRCERLSKRGRVPAHCGCARAAALLSYSCSRQWSCPRPQHAGASPGTARPPFCDLEIPTRAVASNRLECCPQTTPHRLGAVVRVTPDYGVLRETWHRTPNTLNIGRRENHTALLSLFEALPPA